MSALPANFPEIWRELQAGRHYAKQGDYRRAVHSFTQIIAAVDPRQKASDKFRWQFSCKAYFCRGKVYAKCERQIEAIRDFTQVIRVARHRPERSVQEIVANAYFRRGTLRQEMGITGPAIADFTQVIARAPRLFVAVYHRGLAYQELLESQLAAADFRRAQEINPRLFAVLEEIRARVPLPTAHPTMSDTLAVITLTDLRAPGARPPRTENTEANSDPPQHPQG